MSFLRYGTFAQSTGPWRHRRFKQKRHHPLLSRTIPDHSMYRLINALNSVSV
jgi:hypothetical protein